MRWWMGIVVAALVLNGCTKRSEDAQVGDYLSSVYLWDAHGRCIYVMQTMGRGPYFKIVPVSRCQ